MRKGFLILMALIAMCSCEVTRKYTFYQVFKTTPVDNSNLAATSDGMVYEDENCMISYAFWAKNGNAGFSIFNKTDKVLCIDMNKSFFVRNGEAFNYYPAQASEGEKVDFQPIIAIPPKAYRSVKLQDIWNMLYVDCDLDRYPATFASISFDSADSPIRFSNYLTYNFGEGTPEAVIENKFYVSRVTNYASPEVFGYELRGAKPCVNKTTELKKYYSSKYPVNIYDPVVLINTSDCFYVPYERNSSQVLYEEDKSATMVYDDYYRGYVTHGDENGWY